MKLRHVIAFCCFVYLLIAYINRNNVKVEYEHYNIKGDEVVSYTETFDVTKVNMEKVESTAIAYVGFKSNKLIIVFNNSLDRCYVYNDVKFDIYKELINSDSVGGYYNKYIKNHYGEVERIDGITVFNGHIIYEIRD